ncbi:uncharacterized protein MONBRDRAFT_6653 [Monosiga brevicollis MX1]|uniref:Uncharacterized protein n=1 Tax=Monosiga brevicollis TaxID=81824 RepID=A9UUW7_MONBE|nr:uncharacterized protein MONBRDRAFT_6653 [Monosiga brevicollis MX1]EDQ90789.1 predicted protein [Monosiga brevicollis MX1]|eukprot:XP_001744086.1 hypothetical protein [Monosiga brevicollis MX1]
MASRPMFALPPAAESQFLDDLSRRSMDDLKGLSLEYLTVIEAELEQLANSTHHELQSIADQHHQFTQCVPLCSGASPCASPFLGSCGRLGSQSCDACSNRWFHRYFKYQASAKRRSSIAAELPAAKNAQRQSKSNTDGPLGRTSGPRRSSLSLSTSAGGMTASAQPEETKQIPPLGRPLTETKQEQDFLKGVSPDSEEQLVHSRKSAPSDAEARLLGAAVTAKAEKADASEEDNYVLTNLKSVQALLTKEEQHLSDLLERLYHRACASHVDVQRQGDSFPVLESPKPAEKPKRKRKKKDTPA